MIESSCPCRATAAEPLAYESCCAPYHRGEKATPTAEALMRSRYSAFAKGEIDYLRETLAPESQGDFDRAATESWARTSEWLGLDILETEKGEPGDTEGSVAFVAHFTRDGKPVAHREKSRFRHIDGHWRFVEEVREKITPIVRGPQPGRNDPCPCGSGKKFKKCCGAAA